MTDSNVSVKCVGDWAVIRVVGRATAIFGPALREFLANAPARGIHTLVFDLGACVYMDSTFIGILTMAAVENRGTALQVSVANAGPAPLGHLASLGVDRLFTYADAPPGDGPWEPLGEDNPEIRTAQLQALGRTALDAHEALGAANPDNVPRFRDVIECLRRETRQPGP